ncbi:MAG: hypothetical protein M0R03_20385 [Novosphingobium sp.]|nr:hypothetical protein [Novosphingobium sp.]
MGLLDKQIGGISEYFVSMEKLRDLNIIKVNLPERWKSFNSEDGKISVEISTHDVILPNNQITQIPVFWVYGKQSEVDFDDLTIHIKSIIKYNNDLDNKKELFQEKGNELKKLFSELDLKTLKTLEFKYRKPKVKKVNNVKKEDKKEEVVEITNEDNSKEEVVC